MARGAVGWAERLHAVNEAYAARREVEDCDVGMEGVPADSFEPKGAGYLFDVCVAAFAGHWEGEDGEACD